VVRKSSLHSNIFFNLAGALLPLCTSLLVIPIYLTRIGPSRFGIISLVWLLFGYFGLFDLGLSQATTNLLARSENQSAKRQREIFWTAAIVNALLGITGAVILGFLGSHILTSFVSIPVELGLELRGAIPWVACLLPLSTTGAVFSGALEAHERFLELNVIQVIGAILGQLLPLGAVILFGPRIEVAIEATFIARLMTSIPIFILAKRQCSRRLLPSVTRKTALDLFHYGGWVTVSNIVGPILVSVDQFMIGAMIGVASVPRYSIPFNIATKILLVPTAMTRALFPQLAKVDLTVARRRAEAITITVSRTLIIICTPLIILCHSALTVWLGANFASKASILSRIIMFGVWINGAAYVPNAMIQSQGQPSTTAKLHLVELLPFFAVLWLGLHFFGLVGAAIAWSLRVLVDAVLLFRAARFSHQILKGLIPSFLLMISAFEISILSQDSLIASIVIASAMFTSTLIYSVAVDPTFNKLYLKYRGLELSE
jgi:O-antigen/teichoic acid export membrane protein